VFAVPAGKGKLKKISKNLRLSPPPPLRHIENGLLTVFSNLSCHLARQISPLAISVETGSPWIYGNDVRSGISTEPKKGMLMHNNPVKEWDPAFSPVQ